VAFSADGRYLAAATKDGTVFRLNTTDFNDTFFANVPHTAAVRSIAIASEAGLLITASEDRALHVYELASLDLIKVYPGHDVSIFDVAVDSKGTQLASASFDGTTKLWDLNANLNRLAYPRGGVQPAAFAALAGRIAVGTPRGVVIADAATERMERVIDVAKGATSLAIDPSAKVLASHSIATGKLTVFDLGKDAAVLQEVAVADKDTRIAIAADASAVAFDGSSGLRVLDVQSGEVRVVEGAQAWAVAPSGALLAVERAAADPKQTQIAVLQLPALTPVGEFAGSAGAQLLWGAGEQVLYLGTARADTTQTQGALQRWDVASKALLPELVGHGQGVSAVSDSARFVATGSGDGSVILWDKASAQALFTLKGHASKVTALAFSPDGTRLLSGGLDGTFQLWDTGEGRPIGVVQSSGQTMADVALGDTRWYAGFSPDGKTVATLSYPALPPFVLHAFPWDEATYGAPVDEKDTLQARVERFKRTLNQ